MPTALSDSLRPMLRHDVAFLQTAEGILVKTEDSTFQVRGAAAYQYVSALLPHLDGQHELAELLGDLPESHTSSVRSLLGALHSRGVIVDRATPTEPLPDDVATTFAPQLALLAHYGESHAALRRVANQVVLVVGGDAEAVGLMGESLRNNGFGALDGRVETRVAGAVDAAAVTDEDLAAHDLVVVVSPDRRLPGAAELSVRAARASTALVAVLRVGDQVVMGPWQGHEPLLQHAALRMTDNAIPGASDLLVPAEAGHARLFAEPHLPSGVGALPVSLTAFEIFKAVSQVMPSELEGAVVLFDPLRLETTSEVLRPHPGLTDQEPAQAGDAGRGAVAEADPDADPAEVRLAAYTPFVNNTVGLARRFLDDDVPQLPIKTGVLLAPVVGAEPVLGFSTESLAAARVAALDEFAARYSLLTLPMTHRVQSAALTIPGHDLATSLAHGAGTEPVDEEWIEGQTVDGERVRLPIDAVLACPLHRRRSRFEPSLHGLGCGPDLEEARLEALISATAGWTAREVLAGRLAVTAAPEPRADDDSATHRLLLQAAARFRAPARLYRVCGAVIPTVLALTDDTAVVRSALSWDDANTDALLHLVGPLQHARHTGEPTTQRPLGDLHGWGISDIRVAEPDSAWADTTQAEANENWAPANFHPTSDISDIADRLEGVGLTPAWVEVTAPDLRGVVAVARALLWQRHP